MLTLLAAPAASPSAFRVDDEKHKHRYRDGDHDQSWVCRQPPALRHQAQKRRPARLLTDVWLAVLGLTRTHPPWIHPARTHPPWTHPPRSSAPSLRAGRVGGGFGGLRECAG